MSNLPYFSGVLYFGAASTLFAFGARGETLRSSPMYYLAFSILWLGIITLLNIRGVDAGKWLNNVSSLGSLVPMGVLLLLAAASYWRFGPAVKYAPASFAPHWSL